MKTSIIILLSAILALNATGADTTLCSIQENQNGFFLRKCVILHVNNFGGNINAVKSGVPFQYLIWFTVPENATNVVIKDIVPAELEILNTIPAATIDAGTNTITYEVPEGTAGNTAQSLAVNVKFYPGITCNETLVFNAAQIEADQLSQPLVTDSLAVEAFAVNPFALDKESTLPQDPATKIYGGVVGQPVTYLLKIHKPYGYYYSDIGQQNLDNIFIYDIIPAGAELVGTVVCDDQIVEATIENESIKLDCSSFTLLGAQMTPQLICRLQINYPEEHFPLDTIIENEAYYTGNSCGEVDSVFSNKIQVRLGEAAPGGSASKIVKVINPVSGCVGNYWFYPQNTGNLPLDNYIIEDLLPEEVEIQEIVLFRSDIDTDVPLYLTIGYEDQITFESVPNGTILYSVQQGEPIPPGTSIKIQRGNPDKPIPLDSYCRYRIEFLISDDPVLESGYEVTNEATFTFTYNQDPIDIITSEVSFEIEDFQPKVCLYKNVCNPQNSYMYGDIVRYRFTIQNNGSANLDGAIIEDLLDSSLEYLGNESYYSSNLVNPDCGTEGELPPDTSPWAGLETEHSLSNLKWTEIEIDPYCEQTNIWLGSGCDPPGITYYFIEFDAEVKQNAPAGTISNFFTMSGGGLVSEAESEVAYITINNVFGVNAEKFISKDNGTSWHKTLDVNQNDELMFRLQFTNNSNYPVTEIVLMDLLPMNFSASEDRMILDRNSNRASQFGLEYFNSNLPGISTNPPASFNLPAVLVDNENNICTPELLYNPDLCNTPLWGSSQGKNVKFNFGTENILPPGGQLNCDFNVDIPVNTPSGLMACNSFAVRSKGILTLGNDTIIIDNIASESDVACLNYSFEPGNDSLCEDPLFFWAEQAGGSKNGIDYAWGNAIVTDANKNIYTCGAYEGTVVFPNGEVLSSGSAESKIFVAKQNETGDFLWISELGDVVVNEGRAIAISSTGDIYITGIKTFFNFNLEFVAEAFVAKFKSDDGTLLVTTATDFSYWPSAGNDIALDEDDNVYITGYECMWLKSDEPPKSSSYCGWDDVLLKRFDRDLNIIVTPETGCFGGNGVDVGKGIAIDLVGNIYITGFFEQTVNFNPDWSGNPVFKTSVGGRDIFILKLNSDMEFNWVATMGGENDDCGSDIVADESGNIYITGFVSYSTDNVTDFNISHNPVGISDSFVSKWSSIGDCLWTMFSETENLEDFSKGYSIEIGPDQDEIFSTGLFGGTVNFDPNNYAPETTLHQDMFLLKLETSTGNYISNMLNEGLGDNSIDPGQHSIAVDNNGCLYTTGRFTEADFDPMNDYNLSASGMCDIFVQKLCCCCPGEEDFFARLSQGFKVEIDNENCVVTVSLHQFNACHWIANDGPSWGDGSIIQPLLTPANREWSHYYSQSGEFEICTTVYELGENGDVCYFGQVCTMVELWCLPFLCKDTTICCTDPPILLSGEAPDGSIFSGDFVTEEDGEFYFNPNCDDFPAPEPPGYPGFRKFHEITYTFTDPSGNPYSCNFIITVDSDEPPPSDCPPLDTIVCLNSEPFWHGIIYIDPAELGIGTHYLNCTFSNACWGWSWATVTIPPAPTVRRKVTVIENAASFIIPNKTVCEGDNAFVYFGIPIDPDTLNIGDNTLSFQLEICGEMVTCNFIIHVIGSWWCPVLLPIPISDPWNVISLWYQPYPPDIWPIFEPEIYLGNFEVALSKNGIFWPSGGINTIGNWDVYQGYKVKMNEPGWIDVIGEIPEDKTISLDPGANYIPVLSAEYYSAMDIFTQLGSGLIFAYDLGSELLYWPQGGIYMLDVLEPGKGYLVGMTQSGQATYDPLLKSDFKNYVPLKPKVHENAPWNVSKSGSPHLISIDRSALAEFDPGDFIGVFNAGGMCAGMSQIDKSESNLLLVAYGNDFTEKTAKGLADSETMQFKVYRASTMDETHVAVTFDASMPNMGLFTENGLSKIMKIKTGATSVGENVVSNIQIYPNPSDGTFTIVGMEESVTVRIFNLLGDQVYSGELKLPSSMDISTQPKGIYYISIQTLNGTHYQKLIIN